MTAPDIISLLVSFMGLLVAAIAIYYTYCQKRAGLGIKTIDSRDMGFKTILHTKPNAISIMGISLRGLFRYAIADEWIKLFAESIDCRIRILLLNPYSLACFKLAQRESELSDTNEYYKSYLFLDILETLKYLDESVQSRTKSGNLEIRLYDDIPLGMLVLTGDYCLLEAYSSPEMRQLRTLRPTILITKTSASSLHDHMRNLFDRTWNNAVPFSSDFKTSSLDELSRIRNMIIHGRQKRQQDALE
jgi:hypothetical protein